MAVDYLVEIFENKGLVSKIKGKKAYLYKCPSCGGDEKAYLSGGYIYCHKTGCELYGGKVITDYYEKEEIYGNLGKFESDYEIAANHFNKQLLKNSTAVEILESEEGYSREIIEELKIGIVSDTNLLSDFNDNGLWKESGNTMDEKAKFGYSDGMIVYPIIKDGIVVSMRFKYKIDNRGNYIKSWEDKDGESRRLDFVMASEFTGKIVPSLYNIDDIEKFDRVIIVEGEGDVATMKIAYPEYGVIGTGGSGGNSISTFSYLNNNYKNKEFILCFDNDEPGFEYTLNFVKNLNKIIYILSYQSGDPKDACKREEEFEEISVFEWLKENEELLKDSGELVAHKIMGGSYHFLNYHSLYYKDSNGKKKEFKIPITKPTAEIINYSKNLISYKYGEKLLLINRNSKKFIRSYGDLTSMLYAENKATELIANNTINKKEFFEMFVDSSMKIDRLVSVKEIGIDKDPHTYLLNEWEYEGEDNGKLRELLDLFTLRDLRDRYIFGAYLLSFFLPRKFDGNKPLFGGMADTTSNGKTTIINEGCKAVWGGLPIEWKEGSEEEMLQGIEDFANPTINYDNLELQDLTNRAKYFTRQTTDDKLKTHIMYESHAQITNNFTHTCTINANDLSFNTDFKARMLIYFTDNSMFTDDQIIEIVEKVENFDRDALRRNIQWIIENPNLETLSVLQHEKFKQWSTEIVKYLSIVFPEVEEFNFQNSKELRSNNYQTEPFRATLEEFYIRFNGELQDTRHEYRFIGDELSVSFKSLYEFGIRENFLNSKFKIINFKKYISKSVELEDNFEFIDKKIRFAKSNQNELCGISNKQGIIYKLCKKVK